MQHPDPQQCCHDLYCHDPFPKLSPCSSELSLLHCMHSIPTQPGSSGHHNQPQPCLLHCIVNWGQNPCQNAPPQPQGCSHLLSSCGHHMTITQPCTTCTTWSEDPLTGGAG